MAIKALKRTHHIALIASDYERAKRFYTQVLGLAIVAETFRAERESWKLDLALPDGVLLELFSFPNAPARPSQPEACGLRHLAFAVDDIDLAITQLAEEGVACEPTRIDPLNGNRYTFFADPDGLPLELVECR